MPRRHRRWAAIACFASWALGPAIGMGLAAHELEHHGAEHHGPGARQHSHAVQAVEVFLHGHLHEEGAEDHAHELAPPSFTPSRLGKTGQLTRAALAAAGALSPPQGGPQVSGSPPEPRILAPPDLHGLCVMRL